MYTFHVCRHVDMCLKVYPCVSGTQKWMLVSFSIMCHSIFKTESLVESEPLSFG